MALAGPRTDCASGDNLAVQLWPKRLWPRRRVPEWAEWQASNPPPDFTQPDRWRWQADAGGQPSDRSVWHICCGVVLEGTAGPDILRGLAGSDVLYGFARNDVLYGGPGRDPAPPRRRQ